MNGYFPSAPRAPQQPQPQQFDPFGRYAQMAQPTADQRRQQMAQQFQQQIMNQPAETDVQGYGQLATGIGMGLAGMYAKAGSQFPEAPGGAEPDFMTTLGNIFTNRNNGGLY